MFTSRVAAIEQGVGSNVLPDANLNWLCVIYVQRRPNLTEWPDVRTCPDARATVNVGKWTDSTFGAKLDRGTNLTLSVRTDWHDGI
jgi:hypothetical protein